QEELSKLPHIPRNLLHLKKFIGSGAFGKVYEGVITGDNMTALDVAIKTLHLQASDIEKREFLKEALLMNRFRHEKLLHLIGVCFEDECNFIVIELMREKDLLTFLRKEKSSEQPNVSLSTMLSICQDVAEGCEYLQGMRFVHRDLAARNCLVSYDNAGKLIVKIGDFGLARDVYINDYYKKEGEGLLPVRWMAPESLVDGIFTTYSDIWSFGVLIWEVLSLGNQPYLAQSNLEVLQYVRSGGILDRPSKCPDQLYNLMVRCWAYQPDKRPCFHTIVKLIKHVSHQMIQNRDYGRSTFI
ncbi:hypothetical protein HELRODRAFT_63524, partial [Helobdella robusta]|uniref:receptor protein-tyrosine kinase n=1 Tax=Helobdella robusta TaxID=6412 RepID=T1FXG9_HELRO